MRVAIEVVIEFVIVCCDRICESTAGSDPLRIVAHLTPDPPFFSVRGQVFLVRVAIEVVIEFVIAFCDCICDSVCDSTVGSDPLRIVATSLQIHLSSLCADAHK